MSEANHKPTIGGLKFSEELVQVSFTGREKNDSSFNEILRLIADKRINITFLCHALTTSEDCKSSFCVAREDYSQVQAILDFSSFSNLQRTVFHSVGTITLFPHRNSFNLLGLIVRIFGQSGYPIYSMGSSISALAVNTEFSALDSIAEKLQMELILPENHAPFRQEFHLKEIR
ncbi:hypothetical protein DGMP_09060 [Desulfomarina profundi]|uniref:Uncharacterized protein n=1 Tax=Desulfomarina profundi TaxID=2772557 RepID=A0A8D5JCX0_9BACT|nr:hypothetical protein [Desulfomarina profundi]BCL60213.1 hypothetical protein DGMP_09060 [Desulfomarina profundi]